MMFYFLQLRCNNLWFFCLQFIICYNLYQLVQQAHLIYIIGYKFCILFYIGYLMIYLELDIFSCILWIVYGSFLIVIFIMSFSWVEVTHFLFFEIASRYWVYLLIILAMVLLVYFNLVSSNEVLYGIIWEVIWINYYEVLAIDLEEELEVLGWGLGFDNLMAVFLISILLTIACICIVCLTAAAKKRKIVNYFGFYKSLFVIDQMNRFLCLRTQSAYMQEYKRLGIFKRQFQLFHNRRI